MTLHNKLRHRVQRRNLDLFVLSQDSLVVYVSPIASQFGWIACKSQEDAVFSLPIIINVIIHVVIIELYTSNLLLPRALCTQYIFVDWLKLVVLFCICNFSDPPNPKNPLKLKKKETKMDPSDYLEVHCIVRYQYNDIMQVKCS